MNRSLQGILFVLCYCLLSAGQTAYVGRTLHYESPMIVIAICFGMTTLFFLATQLFTPERIAIAFRTSGKDLIILNVYGAVSWMTAVYSLEFLAPALADLVGFAVGPLVLTYFWRWLRPQTPSSGRDRIAAWILSFGLIFLIFDTLEGHSALRAVDPQSAALGFAMAVLSGLAAVGIKISAKRIHDRGVDTTTVMSLRFHLLILVAAVFSVADSSHEVELPLLGDLLALSALGFALPLFLYQAGLRRLEPITVAMMQCLIPVFTEFLQIFVDGLKFSWYSFAGITVSLLAVAYGLRARAGEA